MPVLPMGVKLIGYLAAVSLTLRYSYRLCSHANNRISSLEAPVTVVSLLALLMALVPLAATLAVTVLFIIPADGSPMPILAMTYHPGALSLALRGAGLGFACVMLMFGCGLAGRFISVRRVDDADARQRLPRCCGGFADYVGGAILEEIAMRGYVFYLISSVFGGAVAVVGSSVVFALVHLVRPDRIPAVFTLNAFIFGLLTGASRYYTGGLWLPIGLHLGWNVTAGPILGLPYAGVAYEKGLLRSEVRGPQWFTGGLYSPDAGVLGTLALLVAAAALRFVAPML